MAYMLLVVEKVGDREERSESKGRALYEPDAAVQCRA